MNANTESNQIYYRKIIYSNLATKARAVKVLGTPALSLLAMSMYFMCITAIANDCQYYHNPPPPLPKKKTYVVYNNL